MSWLIGAILLAGILLGLKVGEARAQYRRALRDLRTTRDSVVGLLALTRSSAVRWFGWGALALLVLACSIYMGISGREAP